MSELVSGRRKVRWTRWAAALAAVAAVATGCATDGLPTSVGVKTGDTTTTAKGGKGDTTTTRNKGDQVDPSKSALNQATREEVIAVAAEHVDAFWQRNFSKVFDGETYTQLQNDSKPIPYTADTDPEPCGNPPFKNIQQNAFYCPPRPGLAADDSDLIAYDNTDGHLVDDLFTRFGPFSLGIVFAHEWGHAVQHRGQVDNRPTITLEQQADCFAGAWVKDVKDGNEPDIAVTDDDLDRALAGFLLLSDSPGTSSADDSAHGSGFDRVSAYSDGVLNGADVCKKYSDQLPRITEDLPAAPQGQDVAFADLLSIVTNDLNDFWGKELPDTFAGKSYQAPKVTPFDPSDASSLPQCSGVKVDSSAFKKAAFYCPSDNFVAFDQPFFTAQADKFGDFAVGTVIATQFSHAVVSQSGNDGQDLKANLEADCLTGAWAASLVPGTPTFRQGATLQAGDLDQTVAAFILYAKSPEGLDQKNVAAHGKAFERVASFQKGFRADNGPAACKS